MNLFDDTPIRSMYIKETDSHWFSAVDLCSALLKCDYQKGRNYWKWLKSTLDLRYNQSVRFTNRLKMEAADGRLRFTDVLDPAGVCRLIAMFPGRRADSFKLWLAKLATDGAEVTKSVTNTLIEAKDTVRRKVGNVFETLERKDFNILGIRNFRKKADDLHFFPQAVFYDDDFVSCDKNIVLNL